MISPSFSDVRCRIEAWHDHNKSLASQSVNDRQGPQSSFLELDLAVAWLDTYRCPLNDNNAYSTWERTSPSHQVTQYDNKAHIARGYHSGVTRVGAELWIGQYAVGHASWAPPLVTQYNPRNPTHQRLLFSLVLTQLQWRWAGVVAGCSSLTTGQKSKMFHCR